MAKKELLKELESLTDSYNSNYALETKGYNRGILDAIYLVNKYFDLANVRSMLKCNSCGVIVSSRKDLDCYNNCHQCTYVFYSL